MKTIDFVTNNPYKVYQMNEFDWVVAKGEEEAIVWYEKETGTDVDREEVRECDLEKEGQYVEFKDEKRIAELDAGDCKEVIIPMDDFPEKRGFGSLLKYGGDWYIKVPFKDVLPMEGIEPYITASTEW